MARDLSIQPSTISDHDNLEEIEPLTQAPLVASMQMNVEVKQPSLKNSPNDKGCGMSDDFDEVISHKSLGIAIQTATNDYDIEP